MSGVGFLDGRTRNQKRHVWRDGRWVLRLTHYQQIPFDSDDRQHQHFNRMGIGRFRDSRNMGVWRLDRSR